VAGERCFVVGEGIGFGLIHEPLPGLVKRGLPTTLYIASIWPQLTCVISKAANFYVGVQTKAPACPTTAATASHTVVAGKQVRVNPV